jgi:uncharacterized membrane protein
MIASPSIDRLMVSVGRVLDWGNRISTALLVAGLLLLAVDPVGVAIIRVGLMILLATPVARVIAATVGFLRAREWSSAVMSGAVLLVLVGSVIAALRSG